ncbi:MAG: hypothetical protein HY059_09265 [Proteobacteria bacterium]|nr:hypothetical protein [Pseudomonadota bacterium]
MRFLVKCSLAAAALLALLVVAALRPFGWSSVPIQDAGKAEAVVLRAAKPVTGIQVRVVGRIDGAATIERAYAPDRRMYGPQKIGPGAVSLHVGGDWYSETCILYYEPGTARSGSLTVEYKFQ